MTFMNIQMHGTGKGFDFFKFNALGSTGKYKVRKAFLRATGSPR